MIKEIKCKCGHSEVFVDPNNTNMIVGVIGVIHLINAQIIGTTVVCLGCKSTIYSETK